MEKGWLAWLVINLPTSISVLINTCQQLLILQDKIQPLMPGPQSPSSHSLWPALYPWCQPQQAITGCSLLNAPSSPVSVHWGILLPLPSSSSCLACFYLSFKTPEPAKATLLALFIRCSLYYSLLGPGKPLNCNLTFWSISPTPQPQTRNPWIQEVWFASQYLQCLLQSNTYQIFLK